MTEPEGRNLVGEGEAGGAPPKEGDVLFQLWEAQKKARKRKGRKRVKDMKRRAEKWVPTELSSTDEDGGDERIDMPPDAHNRPENQHSTPPDLNNHAVPTISRSPSPGRRETSETVGQHEIARSHPPISTGFSSPNLLAVRDTTGSLREEAVCENKRKEDNSESISSKRRLFEESAGKRKRERSEDKLGRSEKRRSRLHWKRVGGGGVSDVAAFVTPRRSGESEEMRMRRNSSMMSRRRVSQISNESRAAEEMPYYLHSSVGKTALDRLLHVVGQEGVREWSDVLSKETLCVLSKLGEGTYGEVFAATFNGADCVLKVIPFEDDGKGRVVNGETVKSAADILPEILITRELSSLNNEKANNTTSSFISLVQCLVVRGIYPKELLEKWDQYAEENVTENVRPSDYSSPDALFLVIALGKGGEDVEKFTVRNENEALSTLFQLALALIVAEEELEFEHRDLHNGNALIGRIPKNNEIQFRIEGQDVFLKSYGVQLSVIDFTNSRLRKQGSTIFLDLEQDQELFKLDCGYQGEIYRMMRDQNGGNWEDFVPKSNVYWLHYMAKEIILEERKEGGRAKRFTQKRRKALFSLFNSLLNFERIKDFIASDEVQLLMKDYMRQSDASPAPPLV